MSIIEALPTGRGSARAGFALVRGHRAASLAVAAFAMLACLGMQSAAEPVLDDVTSSLDRNGNFRLTASARLNAPPDKVFNALANPERVARLDSRVTSAKVLSTGSDGKIVEFTGSLVALANAPRSLRIKISADRGSRTVRTQTLGNSPLKSRGEYRVQAANGGKTAIIRYTSVSSDVSKVVGFEVPEFMRKQAALDNFMRNLHNVGRYISGVRDHAQ